MIEQVKVCANVLRLTMKICSLQKVNARIIIVWLPRTPVIITIHFWCMVSLPYMGLHYLCIHVCQVVKNQLTGPDFVWLLPGWYRSGWWNDVSDADCTAAEMKKGLEHSMAYASNSIVDSNVSRVIVSGKVCRYSQILWCSCSHVCALLECFTVSK